MSAAAASPALRPGVTVVSAWYNRTEDIEASVASVLDQDGVELDYIIVDDCSTDETAARLAAIADPRLRVIRNRANIGFTRSMIRAVAEARGTYVAVHDAGDISRPGRLAAQVAFLEAHRDHVAVGTGIENHVLATGAREIVVPPPVAFNRYSHGEVMFRRADYEAVGGYREILYYSQDVDLWWRLGERGRLGRIDDVLYERRIFETGVKSNLPVEVMQSVFSNLGAWCATLRRRTGTDPGARLGARALLEQRPTFRFQKRIRRVTKAFLQQRRLAPLGRSLGVVPAGMMPTRGMVLYAALRLVAPRPRALEAPRDSLFGDGDGMPAAGLAAAGPGIGAGIGPGRGRVSLVSVVSARAGDGGIDPGVWTRPAAEACDAILEHLVVHDGIPGTALPDDPRRRVLRTDRPLGVTGALIHALEAATGDYVVCHAADDPPPPGVLAAQAAFLDAHLDHVAVDCGVGSGPERATGMMFRRAAYEAVGGYRALFHEARDVDLWVRLGECGRLGRLKGAPGPAGTDGPAHDPADAREAVLRAVFCNLALWSAVLRRQTGRDPVARRHGCSVLEQQPVAGFDARLSALLAPLAKARRWRALMAALDVVPLGLIPGRHVALYAVLRLCLDRPPPETTVPMSLHEPPDRAPPGAAGQAAVEP